MALVHQDVTSLLQEWAEEDAKLEEEFERVPFEELPPEIQNQVMHQLRLLASES